MPITTSGGSGTATGTFTNSVSTANGIGSGNISVFTTPNTSNAIFVVNIQVSASTAATSNLSKAKINVPGVMGFSADGTAGRSPSLNVDGTEEQGAVSGTIKCGPNTLIALPVNCKNGASASAATFGYRVQYDYLSVIVS